MRLQSRALLAAASFCAGLLFTTSGHAALESRLGGQALYDTDLNITWAANANINGLMNWTAANTWVAGLVIDGISGWRLPTSDTCAGFNCTGSEMGHLFYSELGGSAGSSITTVHSNTANYNLFSNVQSYDYWSGTEYAPDPSNAWIFRTSNGSTGASGKPTDLFALAVRSGDVAAIPEPETYAMMLAGLGLIGLMRRRRG